jgi:hypothetical protein
MDKGLTVPKWVLIVGPNIPQMPQSLSAQFVCPSPKILDFKGKKASLGVRSPCIICNKKNQTNKQTTYYAEKIPKLVIKGL